MTDLSENTASLSIKNNQVCTLKKLLDKVGLTEQSLVRRFQF